MQRHTDCQKGPWEKVPDWPEKRIIEDYYLKKKSGKLFEFLSLNLKVLARGVYTVVCSMFSTVLPFAALPSYIILILYVLIICTYSSIVNLYPTLFFPPQPYPTLLFPPQLCQALLHSTHVLYCWTYLQSISN